MRHGAELVAGSGCVRGISFQPVFPLKVFPSESYRLVERLLYGFLDRQAIGYEELDSRGTGTHEGEIGA